MKTLLWFWLYYKIAKYMVDHYYTELRREALRKAVGVPHQCRIAGLAEIKKTSTGPVRVGTCTCGRTVYERMNGDVLMFG